MKVMKAAGWATGLTFVAVIAVWVAAGNRGDRGIGDDAGSPFAWCDLGGAAVVRADFARADYCYQRAEQLGGNSPAALMRIANYRVTRNDGEGLLRTGLSVLQSGDAYDDILFLYFDRMTIHSDRVLAGLRDDRRGLTAWLRHLERGKRMEDADKVWVRLRELNAVDDRLAGVHADAWLAAGDGERAVGFWSEYLGPRTKGYPRENRIFNGKDLSEFFATSLDWRPSVQPGVRIKRSGGLDLAFSGTANLDGAILTQTVWLAHGIYDLRARMRWEGITTDRGIGVRIAGLPADTGDVRGSGGWEILRTLVNIGESGVYRVEIYRNRSLKFDSKIRGTVSIGSVELTPVG